jgi:metal-responsive CopG/Arc/MetJ family transcriptional regulator
MGLIRKVQHETKKPVSVQLEVGLLEQLDRYAEHLRGTREYVISEALRAALKEADAKDKEWKALSDNAAALSAARPSAKVKTAAGKAALAADMRDGSWHSGPAADKP